MVGARLLSLVLVRGRTVDDFDRVLESFPVLKVADTWEAESWEEAELALTGDVKAACEVSGWLCVLDAEAFLPDERLACRALSVKFEAPVFALFSDERSDYHFFSYHSEERSRTRLCVQGSPKEETGLALFQEAGLELCESGTDGMLKLMRRVAFDYDRVKEGTRYVLKRFSRVISVPDEASYG
jgi:hypothetical protein